MDEANQIVKQTSSHLYTRKGWQLENVSNRVVGIVFVNYRKKWQWTGWKERWMELHENYLLFYKYNSRKRQYSQIIVDFHKSDAMYTTTGIECDGEMFCIPVFKNGRKKFYIKTPHKTGITLLFPLLEACLNSDTSGTPILL
jgi:hypothetical protein